MKHTEGGGNACRIVGYKILFVWYKNNILNNYSLGNMNIMNEKDCDDVIWHQGIDNYKNS